MMAMRSTKDTQIDGDAPFLWRKTSFPGFRCHREGAGKAVNGFAVRPLPAGTFSHAFLYTQAFFAKPADFPILAEFWLKKEKSLLGMPNRLSGAGANAPAFPGHYSSTLTEINDSIDAPGTISLSAFGARIPMTGGHVPNALEPGFHAMKSTEKPNRERHEYYG